MSGQISLWETGECELEAEETFEGTVLMQETRSLLTPADVVAAADELVALARAHSG